MIDRYLYIPYVRGGRDTTGLDCYGLVRMARTELFGKSLLPLHSSVDPGNFRAIERACAETVDMRSMQRCDARPGAVAEAWRASLCVHVGLIVEADGQLWVLETDQPTGPCLTPVYTFESRYTRVIYYDD